MYRSSQGRCNPFVSPAFLLPLSSLFPSVPLRVGSSQDSFIRAPYMLHSLWNEPWQYGTQRTRKIYVSSPIYHHTSFLIPHLKQVKICIQDSCCMSKYFYQYQTKKEKVSSLPHIWLNKRLHFFPEICPEKSYIKINSYQISEPFHSCCWSQSLYFNWGYESLQIYPNWIFLWIKKSAKKLTYTTFL